MIREYFPGSSNEIWLLINFKLIKLKSSSRDGVLVFKTNVNVNLSSKEAVTFYILLLCIQDLKLVFQEIFQRCFNVARNGRQRQINVETTCSTSTLEFTTLKEACSEPCKISDVELFAKLVDNWKPLIFSKKKLRPKLFERVLNVPQLHEK